ncbi:MAG: hypothetical protein JNL10_16905 [Verrucomicrobiales bacterium]|nr:hypothetical protein [Verrucomicrobiales bacterium]
MSNSTPPQSEWPASGLQRDDYVECFRTALYRMATVLNCHGGHHPLDRKDLKRSDKDLRGRFDADPQLRKLVRLRRIDGDPNESNEERAEDHFYGRFEFRKAKTAAADGDAPLVLDRITHEATDTFIDWSFQRLHRPSGDPDTLMESEYPQGSEFAAHCAANYILKNFWHNFVHARYQNISHDNYHHFGGSARFDSDFEADNLGTLFLLHSYGIPLRTAGKIGDELQRIIRRTFARNQCNRVFATRAELRATDRTTKDEAELWEDFEWIRRRRLSNELSQALAAQGMAAAQLGIHFTGSLKKGKSGPYRKGTIVAMINGVRLDSGCAPYLPADDFIASSSGSKLPKSRQDTIRSFGNSRHREAVTVLTTTYRKLLHEDARLRTFADESLQTLFRRVGMSRPD